MKLLRHSKISIKITVIYSGLFLLVLLLLNLLMLIGVRYYIFMQADQEIDTIKTVLVNQINENQNIDLTNTAILYDLPQMENVAVRIIENGTVVNKTDNFNYNLNWSRSSGQIKQVKVNNVKLKYLDVPLTVNNNAVTIQIVKDLDSEYDFLGILFSLVGATDLFGMLFSVLLGLYISKKLLRPVDEMTKTAKNISIHNLNERIDVKGPDDELSRLAITFNEMITRLNSAFQKQNQFVADASHELRTPIAVVNGYINLLDRWGKNDPEAINQAIEAIKFEANNMAMLVERLLFLAKGDSSHLKIEKHDFMLNELIEEVTEETKLIAAKKNVLLTRNDPVLANADDKLFKQMLRIFIDNAIKFTRDDGHIEIALKKTDEGAEITVKDDGIGIAKEELPKIFERFYTVDKSRSKEVSGTGLGLSIAKSILDMHGGEVEVDSVPGKGTTIKISLHTGE